MCSTDLTRMLKKIYVSAWMRGKHQHPQRKTTCQHSLRYMTKSMSSKRRLTSWRPRALRLPPLQPASPFSLEIQQASLPTRFRIRTMTTYEGKMDPQDHFDAFNDQMDLLQISSCDRCRCFAVTLTATTKKWFKQTEPETVTFWM